MDNVSVKDSMRKSIFPQDESDKSEEEMSRPNANDPANKIRNLLDSGGDSESSEMDRVAGDENDLMSNLGGNGDDGNTTTIMKPHLLD